MQILPVVPITISLGIEPVLIIQEASAILKVIKPVTIIAAIVISSSATMPALPILPATIIFLLDQLQDIPIPLAPKIILLVIRQVIKILQVVIILIPVTRQ